MNLSGFGVFCVGVVCLVAAGALAKDWPHWRGPSYTGASKTATSLPVSPKVDGEIAWTYTLPGPSAGTPLVLGDSIFIASTQKDKRDLLAICLDRRTGEKRWERHLGTSKNPRRSTAASPSPATDGTRIFFLFADQKLHALDRKGKVLWKKDLCREFGQVRLKFGYSASPLVLDGVVYVAMLGSPGRAFGKDKSCLVAMDAATGKTKWCHRRGTDAVAESRDSYSSPIPVTNSDGTKSILLTGADYVTSHSCETGKELWRVPYTARKHGNWRLVPTPVIFDGAFYTPTPRGRGFLAATLPAADAKGLAKVADKKKASTTLWTLDKDMSDVPSPLLYDGLLYLLSDRGTMTCVDPKSGKVHWREKLSIGSSYASPSAGDGKIYCMGRGGEIAVLQAGKVYKPLASWAVKGRSCDASIVLGEGELFIRTDKELLCVRKRKAK